MAIANNRFYQHRKGIRAVSKQRGVDLDTASTMFAKEHGWTGWQNEMNAWKALIRQYERAKAAPTSATKYMDKNNDGHIDVRDLFD